MLQEIANRAREKTELQARTLIILWFVASSHVMIFAVIGHNTINIPEIFQVFTVSPSHCNCTFSILEDLDALYFNFRVATYYEEFFKGKLATLYFGFGLGNSSLKL